MGVFLSIIFCFLFYFIIIFDWKYSDFSDFIFNSIISCLFGVIIFAIICIFTTSLLPTESITVKNYDIYKIHVENAKDSDDFYIWKDPSNSDSYKCLIMNGNKIETKSISSSDIIRIEDPNKTKFTVYSKQYTNPNARKFLWLYSFKWQTLNIPDKYIKINIDFR